MSEPILYRKRANTRWGFGSFWNWCAGEHDGEKFVRITHGRNHKARRGALLRVESFDRPQLAGAIRRGITLLRADAR